LFELLQNLKRQVMSARKNFSRFSDIYWPYRSPDLTVVT